LPDKGLSGGYEGFDLTEEVLSSLAARPRGNRESMSRSNVGAIFFDII
jgi:hypothetical protein